MSAAPGRIKVMVVDDSAVVRQVVTEMLQADPGIEVICAVADPILAIARMNVQWPDVIVLDVEMPRMDGITFLKKIMAERPTPVVICSTLAEAGAETSMAALAAGAVAIITKPKIGLKQFLVDASDDLVTAVKTAAKANVLALRVAVKNTADVILPAASGSAMIAAGHPGLRCIRAITCLPALSLACLRGAPRPAAGPGPASSSSACMGSSTSSACMGSASMGTPPFGSSPFAMFSAPLALMLSISASKR